MTRSFGSNLSFSTNVDYRSSGYFAWKNQDIIYTDRYEMVSENHFPLNPNGNSGGPFLLEKFYYHVTPSGSPNKVLWNGDWWPTKTVDPLGWSSTGTDPVPKTSVQINSLGSQAISTTAPTNPAFDGATALGELREGLPSIVGLHTLKERTLHARNAGHEYLNWEFGWKPLVSELKGLAKAVHNSHEILTQYHKDSGNKIRRRRSFPTEANSSYYSGRLNGPPQYNAFATGIAERSVTNDQWFSGAFRYYIPTGHGTIDRFNQYRSDAARLYGLRLTPDVVWNLSPWTWAIDWFTDCGTVMTNISNLGQDGLVMQYGYMMTSHKSETRYIANGATFLNGYSKKVRTGASPYGFGIDLSSLTPKQAAILVALGLSRS